MTCMMRKRPDIIAPEPIHVGGGCMTSPPEHTLKRKDLLTLFLTMALTSLAGFLRLIVVAKGKCPTGKRPGKKRPEPTELRGQSQFFALPIAARYLFFSSQSMSYAVTT